MVTGRQNQGGKDWLDRITLYVKLARLDRPVGIWLLLAPCWWGVGLAASGWPPWDILLLLACGAVIMRSAGCVINDIWDRDIDARVVRTADRPLAAGRITLSQAFLFLAGLLWLGLGVLMYFNLFTIILAMLVVPLVVLYPLAKRYTYWPQLVLGVTFNWGVLVGWAAVQGVLTGAVFFLYGAAIFWTLGYDTIYAHQDKRDDVVIGVKSSALRLGSYSRIVIGVFYAVAIGFLAWSGYLAGLNGLFFGGLIVVSGHFAWQVAVIDFDNPEDCFAKFQANQIVGGMIFLSIICGQMG